MTRAMLLALGLAGSLAAGCAEQVRGTTRPLGDVEYELAFRTAEEVLEGHFSVLTADPRTGVIECRPQLIDAEDERLLGGSEARHLAKMTVRREPGGVVATCSVALQRQGQEGYSSLTMDRENYRGVPDRTPAEMEGATTPDQNQVWRTTRQDKMKEMQILSELQERLSAMQPPTGP